MAKREGQGSMRFSKSTVILSGTGKEVDLKEKASNWSSEPDAGQILSLILFPGLDSAGHRMTLSAQENSACAAIAPRKHSCQKASLSMGSSKNESSKMMIPPPH